MVTAPTIQCVLFRKALEYKMSVEHCAALENLKLTDVEHDALVQVIKNLEQASWDDGYDDCLMEGS